MNQSFTTNKKRRVSYIIIKIYIYSKSKKNIRGMFEFLFFMNRSGIFGRGNMKKMNIHIFEEQLQKYRVSSMNYF